MGHGVSVPRLGPAGPGRTRTRLLEPGRQGLAPRRGGAESALGIARGSAVQGQDAALAVLGRLLDVLALLDQVVAGPATCWLLKSNRFSRRALTSPRLAPVVNADHQVQAQLLVLGPDEVEQAGGLVRAGRVGFALARVRWLAFLATLRSARSTRTARSWAEEMI